MFFFDAFAFAQTTIVFVFVAALGLRARGSSNAGQYWSKVVRRRARVRGTMMLKRLLLLLGFAALLGAGYAIAAGMTVRMTADGPEPARRRWRGATRSRSPTPTTRSHQITIPRISLESPAIAPGGAFEYVFNGRRGNYGYRQTGGGPNKLGTIVVELKGSVTLKASATIVRGASR